MPATGNIFSRCLRTSLRLLWYSSLVLVTVTLLWLSPALYNRWFRYPKEAAAWLTIRDERIPVADTAGWREWRGILHNHSHLSHDSEVPFEHILRVLRDTDLDFIALSDHCTDQRADFDTQWRGPRGNKLFIPGFEMKDGLMPFGARPGTVLSNSTPTATLAQQAVDSGAVLFVAHPEGPRDWTLPQLHGMEIYNLHVDFKRIRHPFLSFLPDVLINLRRFPDHVLHRQFNRPTDFLQRWDQISQLRPFTGIAANDAHQNVGYRFVVTTNNTLRLEDTSPDILHEFHLNRVTRPIVQFLLGPLEPNRVLFHTQLDPYERSARFVNTHVLSQELGEAGILSALRNGRAYVAFNHLADASSFRFYATNSTGLAVMGESLAYQPYTRLRVLSPLPCRFTFIKDGEPLNRQQGRAAEWNAPSPGVYRVEAELRILDRWIPWVYTNPVRLANR